MLPHSYFSPLLCGFSRGGVCVLFLDQCSLWVRALSVRSVDSFDLGCSRILFICIGCVQKAIVLVIFSVCLVRRIGRRWVSGTLLQQCLQLFFALLFTFERCRLVQVCRHLSLSLHPAHLYNISIPMTISIPIPMTHPHLSLMRGPSQNPITVIFGRSFDITSPPWRFYLQYSEKFGLIRVKATEL